MATFQNATSPLVIPTHDGSGQATHPDVIDFRIQHGMDSWAGYRYWMAMTPYPNANDAHEDPNVIASNDGITWVVPVGITNPLQDSPGSPGLFGADTDMLYDPDEDCLRVYWNNGMRKIYPNMSMSPIVNHSANYDALFGGKYMSWSIWRESATQWHAWMVGSNDRILYAPSTSGDLWNGTPVDCTHELGNLHAGTLPWHLDAQYNKWENRIEFMLATKPVSGLGNVRYLAYGECPVGDYANIKCPISDWWIVPQSGAWDSNTYRSTFVIERQEGRYFYRVWYSGYKTNGNGTSTWNLGYTDGVLGSSFTGGEAINITPSSMTLKKNDVLQFTATDESGNAITPSWSTSDPTIATINGSGLLTALAIGVVTVTAMLDGVSDSVAVYVAFLKGGVFVINDSGVIKNCKVVMNINGEIVEQNIFAHIY